MITNNCQARVSEMGEPILEHESAGLLFIDGARIQTAIKDRSWTITRVHVHVCKHCGCLFAEPETE